MSEAIIYATVIVTAATLAYWWPTLRRKYLWWKLARQMDGMTASIEDLAEAMRHTADSVQDTADVIHETLNRR